MLHYIEGNMFESPAQVLVNTVNTVGVMGKGIALEFKRIYPAMFRQYQELCEAGKLGIGTLWLYKTPHKWILNFPTKKHWRQPSKLEYIEAGLRKFVDEYRERRIRSVAFPMLGCGNGELDWNGAVQPLMESYLAGLPIDVFIYLYQLNFKPEHRNQDEIRQWLRMEPADLPFTEVLDDLRALTGGGRTFGSAAPVGLYAEIVADGDQSELLLSGQNGTVRVDQEQLFELWLNVRAKGLLDQDCLPYGLVQHLGDVQTLFAQLPYFREVRMSYAGHANQPLNLALQLVPPPRKGSPQPRQLETAHP